MGAIAGATLLFDLCFVSAIRPFFAPSPSTLNVVVHRPISYQCMLPRLRRANVFTAATKGQRRLRIDKLYTKAMTCVDDQGTSTSIWRCVAMRPLAEHTLPWVGWLDNHGPGRILTMLQQVREKLLEMMH